MCTRTILFALPARIFILRLHAQLHTPMNLHSVLLLGNEPRAGQVRPTNQGSFIITHENWEGHHLPKIRHPLIIAPLIS